MHRSVPLRNVVQGIEEFCRVRIRQAQHNLFHLPPELRSQQAIEKEVDYVIHVHEHIGERLERQPEVVAEVDHFVRLQVLDEEHGHGE